MHDMKENTIIKENWSFSTSAQSWNFLVKF